MNEQEKISHLRDLVNHPGWAIIKKELEDDCQITESKLFGELPLGENETIDQLQRERIDRLELKNLPENLIKELTEENEIVDYEVYPEKK